MLRLLKVNCGLALFALGTSIATAVDGTWNYAVEISATVSTEAPWSITLTWPEDTQAGPEYSPAYTVYRKAPDATEWGPATALGAGQTSFVDRDVTEGARYEYRVVREFRHPRFSIWDHDGYGYVLAGINVPPMHQRGRL